LVILRAQIEGLLFFILRYYYSMTQVIKNMFAEFH